MTENKQKLPEDWKEVKLGEVVQYKKGKKPKVLKLESFEGAVPYLDIKAFEKGVIRKYADPTKANLITKTDLAVVWDGARSGWVSKGKEGAIGSTIMRLTPIKDHANYIYYFLKSKYLHINSNTRGTGIPHVDPNFLWNLPIPLPPLSEQERIVARLDQLLGEAANYRQLLAQLPKKIEQFRQSVLARAISGELSATWRAAQGLNKDWEEKALKHLGKWLGGGTPRKSEPKFWTEGNVLWISAKDVKAWFLEDSKDKITEEAIVGSSVKLIAANSILFVVRSGILRRTFPIAMNLKETTINQDLKALKPHANIESKYLFYALKGKEQELRSDCMKHGTTVESVDFKKLKDFPIPLPPLAEQKEIVARVEALLAQADALSDYYERAMAGADQLPQTILAKAFRGEL